MNWFRERKSLWELEQSSFPFIMNVWSPLWRFGLKVLFFFLVVFQFSCHVTTVVSGSMTPTLKTRDISLISTIGYGANLPFLNKKILAYSSPKVGDVVAFTPKVYSDSVFVKRILAGPGDTIRFQKGIPIINGVSVKLEYIRKYQYEEDGIKHGGHLYKETLANSNTHFVLYANSIANSGSNDFTEIYTVPKGHYFMVGDNRHNSDDSRSLIGYVEEKEILGRVFFTVLSNGNLLNINPIKWITSVDLAGSFNWVK